MYIRYVASKFPWQFQNKQPKLVVSKSLGRNLLFYKNKEQVIMPKGINKGDLSEML